MTRLYWAYLNRHLPAFEGNHRMAIARKNVARRSEEEKAMDVEVFQKVQAALSSGVSLRPTAEGDLRSWS